ncbi:MAG: YibE/F family protein [Actinomycetota bacterium]|nr:YibE/F family protein [Actinomycetota bacterium]
MDESSLNEWDAFAPQENESDRKRFGAPEYLAALFGVFVLIGLLVFWPSNSAKEQASTDFAVLGVPSEFHEAVVTEVSELPCPFTSDLVCVTISFEIVAGPDADSTYRQEFTAGQTTPQFAVGDVVVLSRIAPSGRIVALHDVPCEFDINVVCASADVRLFVGPGWGSTSTLFLFPGQELGLFVGQNVMVTFDLAGEVLAVAPATTEAMYRYADFQRRGFLLVLFIGFALAVVALGRWRGVAALAGLGLSVIIVTVWLIPSLLDGNPSVAVAMVGAATVAYLALYVSHGVNRTSTVALLGTLAALFLITGLSWLTTVLARFSGLATEEATLLLTLNGFDLRGLLLAGIVIGAAGALDDVTVTQASVIAEIRSANPSIGRLDLFRSGMAIGRAHVGSIVNTLVLAYLGAAMPLTILLVLSQQSLGAVANGEVVAVEIVRALVGTIGIVAAVPLTTWMATVWPAAHRHHHA